MGITSKLLHIFYFPPESGAVLRELHDPLILDIPASVEVDELEAGAAAHQLVESLVTHVEAALGGETWSEETLHRAITLAMNVLSRGQPSARAATPAALIISHQERFTLTS